MGNEARNPMLWFIEAFSVLTGAAFVLSGVANSVIFWTAWGLNYFFIASPSDVIMSGFVFTIALLVIALIASLAVSRFIAGWKKGKSSPDLTSPRRLEYDSLLQQLENTKDVQARSELERNIISLVKKVRQDAVRAVAKMAGIIFLLATSLWLTFFAFDKAIQRSGLNLPENIFYETGLMVANDQEGPISHCRRGKVMWLGSSAAVLDCPSGTKVIHKLDDLRTEPRWGATPKGS